MPSRLRGTAENRPVTLMSPRALLRPAGIGTAAAVLGVVVLYFLARLTGDPLQIVTPGADAQVPVGAAVLFTVVGGLVGYGLAVAVRRLRRPRAWFLAITGVGLVLSLAPPFGAAPLGTALWLDAMHLAAAAAIIPALAVALPATRELAGSRA